MTKFFRPQKDITAYELAVVLSSVAIKDAGRPLWREPIMFTAEQWDRIGAIQRHFADAPEQQW